MKKAIFLFLFLFLIISFVSADTISPGTKSIGIKNHITNIHAYSDYVFIVEGSLGTGMCPYKQIGETGQIDGSYYKFCGLSVYAVKKDSIDLKKIIFKEEYYNALDSEIREGVDDYFASLEKVRVIGNIEHYKRAPVSSPIKSLTYKYEITSEQINGLSEPSYTPTNTKIKLNFSIIISYILVSLISLIIIILIIMRRKNV